MAEGLCRHYKGDFYHVYSAGLQAHGLNPHAVQVMAEINIDISAHESKTLDSLNHIELDEVVTVCAYANQSCPVFKGIARVTHMGFDDPPKLAQNAQTEEQALCHYRRVRDEIKAFIQQLPQTLDT